MDEEARLFHAILFRKGVKCYKRQIEMGQHDKTLKERLEEITAQIDIANLEEELLWDSP
jgi:hypothetical protein